MAVICCDCLVKISINFWARSLPRMAVLAVAASQFCQMLGINLIQLWNIHELVVLILPNYGTSVDLAVPVFLFWNKFLYVLRNTPCTICRFNWGGFCSFSCFSCPLTSLLLSRQLNTKVSRKLIDLYWGTWHTQKSRKRDFNLIFWNLIFWKLIWNVQTVSLTNQCWNMLKPSCWVKPYLFFAPFPDKQSIKNGQSKKDFKKKVGLVPW